MNIALPRTGALALVIVAVLFCVGAARAEVTVDRFAPNGATYTYGHTARHYRHAQGRHHHRTARPAHHTQRAVAVAHGGGHGLIAYLRSHIGGNPTGWRAVWCGKMIDMALRATGHAPGSALAVAYARYGRPADGPCVGCLVVWRHHVGVVTEVVGRAVRVISGNDGHRVRERVRSTQGVIAYRVVG